MEFEKIKEDILGKDYSLSVAFVSEKKIRELNKRYRNIDKPTNILSFALYKDEGEIVLCKSVIRKELKKFGRTFSQLVGYLVIHGMLHLKGMTHSSRMERAETKYDQKYFYRDRYGIHHDQSRSRRIFKGRKKS
jgi:probable rRNA maturation factor